MRLRVLVPGRTVTDVSASRVAAPGTHGSFVMLPHHVDYVAVLIEGIVTYDAQPDSGEHYVAVDAGVLVKQGDDIIISTPNAVTAARLEDLEESVEEQFRSVDERERDARAVLFRIETDVVQRMLELEDN